MNKIRLVSSLLPSIILRVSVLAILLAACAPSAASETGKAPIPQASLTPDAVPVTAAATPYPLATSRGPNLEASDPATVKLASGGLELVEFFRFT